MAQTYFMRAYEVAVQVNDQWRFFDPASTYVPFGMLRWQEAGTPALITDPKEPIITTTPLSEPAKSASNRSGSFRLSDDGTLEGDVHLEYTGHAATNLNAFDLEAPEEMDVRFAIDHNPLRHQASRNFADEINRRRADAFHVAAQFSFDDGRVTDHARAAEIALGSQMDVAASPNRPAETGGDFVIAQIDMRTAAGAVGRRCLIADFVFALTLETRNEAIAMSTPNRFEFSMEGHFFRGSGSIFEFQPWFRRRWRK